MTELWLGFLFGSIGFGFFLYGKKQRKMVPLFVGIGLCIFPYFITNWILMLLVGCVLMLIPMFIKR